MLIISQQNILVTAVNIFVIGHLAALAANIRSALFAPDPSFAAAVLYSFMDFVHGVGYGIRNSSSDNIFTINLL